MQKVGQKEPNTIVAWNTNYLSNLSKAINSSKRVEITPDESGKAFIYASKDIFLLALAQVKNNENVSKALLLLQAKYISKQYFIKKVANTETINAVLTLQEFRERTGLKGDNARRQFTNAVNALRFLNICVDRNGDRITDINAIENNEWDALTLFPHVAYHRGKAIFSYSPEFCALLNNRRKTFPMIFPNSLFKLTRGSYFMALYLYSNKRINHGKKGKREDYVKAITLIENNPLIATYDDIEHSRHKDFSRLTKSINNLVSELKEDMIIQFEDANHNKIAQLPPSELDKCYIHVVNWKTLDENELDQLTKSKNKNKILKLRKQA